MAFSTGASTSIGDLLNRLFTFAAANGWTNDNFDVGDKKASLHKNDVYVHFQWDEAADGGNLAIYQSLGFIAAGTDVWSHTDDSGSGEPSTTGILFDTDRCVNNLAGPHVAYWFFENDASPAYMHVVVEYDSGLFRHFGFGELSKIGDWTGGEYCYGHFWDQTTADIDNPASGDHGVGLEGAYSGTSYASTLHAEGLPGEPSALTKWAVFKQQPTSPGNDRAGVERLACLGGWRGGPWAHQFHGIRISQLNAFKPLIPMGVLYVDNNPTPDSVYLLGFQQDVALVNIGNINPKEEFTVGSDTWVVFPLVRKQYLLTDTEESWNCGIAYKKVTA